MLAYILLLIIIVSAVYLGIRYGSFFDAVTMLFLRGAPFVESATEDVEKMIKLADLKENDKVVDLGSGDGRVVFEAAKYCKKAVGYEINPIAHQKSLTILKKKGKKIRNKISIKKENFMKKDLTEFDVVFVYGIGYAMRPLEEKLKRELRTGSKVVTNYFEFAGMKKKKFRNGVHLYIIGS